MDKFPLLVDIPILGTLFRSSSFQKEETDLVIIVTPHLVKQTETAKNDLPTDHFAEPNDFEFYLRGNIAGHMKGPGGTADVLSDDNKSVEVKRPLGSHSRTLIQGTDTVTSNNA